MVESPIAVHWIHQLFLLGLFIIFNLAIFGGYLLVFSRQKPYRFLFSFLATAFQYLFIALILGVIGILWRTTFIVINLIPPLITIYFYRQNIFDIKIDFLKLKKACLGYLKKYPLSLILPLALVIILGRTLVIAYYNIPSLGDDLLYHVSQLFQYATTGKINDFPTLVIWQDVYPKNADLLMLVPIMFFKNDNFILLFNTLFYFVGYMIVGYTFGRQFVNRFWALCAGLLFFLTPAVVNGVLTGYVDYSINLFLVAAALLAIMLYYDSKNSFLHLFLLLDLGFLIGSKYSLVYPVFILLLVYGYLLFKSRLILQQEFKKRWPAIAAVIIAALFISSYWYIRNYVIYGNPVAPQTVQLAGHELFTSHYPSGSFFDVNKATFQSLFTPKNNLDLVSVFSGSLSNYSWLGKYQLLLKTFYQFPKEYFVSNANQLGPIWAYVGLPAVIVSLVLACYRRDKKFIFSVLLLIVLYLVNPPYLLVSTRYTSFIFILGVIAIIYLLAKIWFKAAGLLLLALLTVAISVVWEVPTGKLSNLEALSQAYATGRYFSVGDNIPDYLSCYDFVRLNIQNSKVAYINFGDYPYTYFLYGKTLSNQVYYFYTLNPQQWEQDVLSNHIDYIVVLSPGNNPSFNNILALMKSDPSHFQTLLSLEGYQGDRYDVCRQYNVYKVTD